MCRPLERILLLALAVIVASGCLATPLPDPPSARAERMSLVSTATGQLELTGSDGSITPGGGMLRVTRAGPPASRAVAAVSAAGSFVATVDGSLTDVLYLEQIGSRDVFLGAVQSAAGDGVTSAPAGADSDHDGSPDAIDCAPTNSTLVGRECSMLPCGVDADCGVGQRCITGACSTCAAAEICGNGLDDDCNGLVDDGC